MDLMELRRRLMGIMASGAEFINGSFTVPADSISYTLNFGKTFSSYLIMVEMSDDSKTAFQNTGTTNAGAVRYLGMYPECTVGNNSFTYGLSAFTYQPSNGSDSVARAEASNLTASSFTFPAKDATASGTARLIKGYSYNYYIVEIK